ncbi:MAG: mechanosensitive ion channel [Novosphingobium sp.]|nr:mechanosensitive ion channel [Novosphingobium sp.]
MAARGILPVFLAMLLGLSGMPAQVHAAVLPDLAGTPASEAAPAPQQTIEAESGSDTDARIAQRITGIFGVLEPLAKVEVTVAQGVVTLRGKVPSTEDIDRAEQIASRVSGVVTVENRLRRDTSVESSVGALNSVSSRIAGLVKMLPLAGAALLVAAVIALFGYLLASLGMVWRRFTPNQFLAELIASAVRFVFVLGGIVVGLNMLGAGALLGAVLGGAGIIGIALGFAMRDTIENYVASILLSVRQPFRPNEWVVIDTHEGRVIRLTSRATILMTLDGNHLRIPNSSVFKAVILNYTRNPQRRFDFVLGIDADDDPTAARHLGADVLAGLDFVLDEPAPTARVEEVGDSNILIRFLGWIDQDKTDWYKARSRAIPAVKDALEQAGFAIPEPIYRLRFDPGAAPVAAGKPAATEPAAKPATPVTPLEEHVGPDDEIAEMVERERQESPDARKDLLDPGRPVE